MGKNQFLIRLTEDERNRLEEIITAKGKTERAIMRARILLRSDLSVHKKASLVQVADDLGTSHTTVLTVRVDYHKLGLEKAIQRKGRSNNIATRRINSKVREQIVLLSQTVPPLGNCRWTLRLLACESVQRGIVTHISYETIASILRTAGVDLRTKKN